MKLKISIDLKPFGSEPDKHVAGFLRDLSSKIDSLGVEGLNCLAFVDVNGKFTNDIEVYLEHEHSFLGKTQTVDVCEECGAFDEEG